MHVPELRFPFSSLNHDFPEFRFHRNGSHRSAARENSRVRAEYDRFRFLRRSEPFRGYRFGKTPPGRISASGRLPDFWGELCQQWESVSRRCRHRNGLGRLFPTSDLNPRRNAAGRSVFRRFVLSAPFRFREYESGGGFAPVRGQKHGRTRSGRIVPRSGNRRNGERIHARRSELRDFLLWGYRIPDQSLL